MKIGKKYIVVIDAGERTLTYTAKVLADEELFFKIEDRDGKVINISKDRIVTFSEVLQ
jgi:hypothetical protein